MGEVETTAEVRLDDGKIGRMGSWTPPNHQDQAVGCQRRKTFQRRCHLGMVGVDLKVIWEMSAKGAIRERSIYPPVIGSVRSDDNRRRW